MERQSPHKKLVIRCRKIKSLSCTKMTDEEIEAFKLINVQRKRNLHLQLNKKRRSEPSFSEVQTKKENTQNRKFQLSDFSAYESAGQASSKTMQKKVRKNLGIFLQKIEEKQEKILLILQERKENKAYSPKKNLVETKESNQNSSNNFFEKKQKRNLRIRQVLNQNIYGKLGKNNFQSMGNEEKNNSFKKKVIFQLHSSNKEQIVEKESLPPFLAKILLQVFGSNKNIQSIFCEEENLKKLLSLRFFIQEWTFSGFVQKLLDYDRGIVNQDQIQSILMNVPFLMTERIYQKALLLIFKMREEEIKQKLSVSFICEKMRKFIEDYPRITCDRESKIKQLKLFLQNKKEELVKMIEKRTFQDNIISVQNLESALVEIRLNEEEIKLFLGNISLLFENLSQIPYKQLFDNKWIGNLR